MGYQTLKSIIKIVLILIATSSPPAFFCPSVSAETTTEPALSLAPPSNPSPSGVKNDSMKNQSSVINMILRLIGCLAIVLGLYLLLMLIVRKTSRFTSSSIPEKAVSVLARGMIEGKPVVIIRFGDRLILTAVNTNGLQALADISDPAIMATLLPPSLAEETESKWKPKSNSVPGSNAVPVANAPPQSNAQPQSMSAETGENP